VLFGTLAPATLFAVGQAQVSAEVAGSFVNLEPLVGVAAGAAVFGDPVGIAQAAGAAAVLTGIALSSLPLLRAGRHRDGGVRGRSRPRRRRRRWPGTAGAVTSAWTTLAESSLDRRFGAAHTLCTRVLKGFCRVLPMPSRVRISDVASAAGVSIATVSASLNDVQSARISADTRARVREVADRLGYVPNRLAQGLRVQRSGTIGFVGDTVATTPYAVGMILGALEAARSADRVVLLMNTEGHRELESRELATLLQHQVDGVLYATMFHRRVEVPAALSDTPVVLVDAESADPTVSSVVPDEVAGAVTAVGELLGNGHRRIGFITNADPTLAATGRLEGYRIALEQAGIGVDPNLVVAVTDIGPEGGYQAARQLLGLPDRPTGVFCFRDLMAMGVYRAAQEARLEIPRDLSVIGSDDMELVASGLFPGLTSVALPHYEMGSWGVHQLLTLMESANGEAKQAKLSGRLTRRRSVAPPPA
jgi:LacI family transcriptional regulator